MGFWWFMLVMVLLTPLAMIIIGLVFKKYAPKQRNFFIGYRTPLSMKNKETWTFAQKHFSKLWLLVGTIILIPSIIPMLFFMEEGEGVIGTVGGIIIGIQILILILSIFPTHFALKKNFDSSGKRKEEQEIK